MHFATREIDLAGDVPAPTPSSNGLPPEPWTWLRQVHGTRVVEVHHPGEWAGAEADAAVTAVPGCPLVIRTADCAPVALLAAEAVGIAHAGWRGLAGGIVANAVAALRGLGATDVRAVVGPCISARHYAFGAEDLDALARRFGDSIRATTDDSRPALDLAAGVHAALREAGITQVERDDRCTAADPGHWFSHRARGEAGRQGSFVWLDNGTALGSAD